jgi:cation transport ATPase
LVIALAAGTGFVGIHMGLSLEAALLRSLTVLVISCPCTLGIAVPLARVAGISSAGREGILVREFSSFEHAEQLDTFVFDKTGTITRGQWTLLKIIPTAAVTEEAALALAASLEQGSEHFIARELLKSAKQAGLELSEPAGRTTFENGISGHVKAREVKIGSDAFVAEEIARLSFASPPQVGGVGGGGSGQALPSEHSETAHSMGSSRSLVYLAVDGELSAIFVFGDEIKQEAPMVIRELQTMGYRLHLVSGDGPDAIKTMGREVGITETHGGLFPEDKATFIRRIQDEGGHVAMVGDGVNDAPALVQANLGISISSGSDLGKEAGGITLMRGHLTQILDFLNLATRVNKKIRENLILSSIYNVLAIPIAMTGLLNPLIAVTAMLLSSLTVIGNTFLLIKRTR